MGKWIIRFIVTVQPLIYFILRGWEFKVGEQVAGLYILMLVCFIISMLITNSED